MSARNHRLVFFAPLCHHLSIQESDVSVTTLMMFIDVEVYQRLASDSFRFLDM